MPKYESCYTDVQKVIDNLQKMNDLLESRHLEDAMRMLEVLSDRIEQSEKAANVQLGK